MKRLPTLVLALATSYAAADIVVPVPPVERDESILQMFEQTPRVVLAECETTATAQAPARVRILAVAKGAGRVGDTLKIPVLRAEVALHKELEVVDVALQKGCTYVLFLEGPEAGPTLTRRTLQRMWSSFHTDGTELLAGGGARVAGKAEECRVWQVVEMLAKAGAGETAERTKALRLRVRSCWHACSALPKELLDAIDGLPRGKDFEGDRLIVTLLREDLPLLGFRDAGLDGLAVARGIKSDDPWTWDFKLLRTPSTVAYEKAALLGPEAEAAAARDLLAQYFRNGNTARWRRYRGLPETEIFRAAVRDAFRNATRDRLDWSRLCVLSGMIGREIPLEKSDVAALVRVFTAPEYGGACGEISGKFGGEFERLSGFRWPKREFETHFFDPALVGPAIQKWWDEAGSKDPEFAPAGK